MNATLNGIVCARCSRWENGKRIQVKHDTIEAVRNCRGPVAAQPSLPTDAEETAAIQRREREEDERVAAYKAQRDAAVVAPRADDPNMWATVCELQAKLPNLDHMHYAVSVLDFEVGPEPVWKFYRIDKPSKGKWAGRTFVSVQASSDYYAVKRPESLITILSAIGADPAKAASDYGHQIGRCGHCSRTLTDPESIARGIGPVCAGKAGW